MSENKWKLGRKPPREGAFLVTLKVRGGLRVHEAVWSFSGDWFRPAGDDRPLEIPGQWVVAWMPVPDPSPVITQEYTIPVIVEPVSAGLRTVIKERRIWKCLQLAGCEEPSDVADMTAKQVAAIDGLGYTAIWKIRDYLAEVGLSLKEEASCIAESLD